MEKKEKRVRRKIKFDDNEEHKYRAWTFTVNNPRPGELDAIMALEARYIIVGEEVGEKEETPHLQGYIYFQNQKTFTAVQRLIPRAHLEVAMGTPQHNYDYCSKQGHFHEKGELPQQGKRTDLIKIAQKLREEDLETVVEEEPGFALLHLNAMKLYKRVINEKNTDWINFRPKNVLWFYGRTGTGKTRTAMELCQGKRFWKWNGTLQWFDGMGPDVTVAVLDDFRPEPNTFALLLRLCDGYPERVPVKGGFVVWNPETVIFTTPYNIRETYQTLNEHVEQLERRVTEIRNFNTNTKENISPNYYNKDLNEL